MRTKQQILLAIILSTLVMTGCAQKPDPGSAKVILRGQELTVRVATTPEQQAQGLGGTENLQPNQGMLFVFPEKEILTFWMKDMLIPIDLIWLDDATVVGFEQRMLPPAFLPDGGLELPTYPAPVPVNRVLEVPAGFVEHYGVQVGDTAEYR